VTETSAEDHDDLLESYSHALDEVFALRSLLAMQAVVTESHLALKTFPSSRRKHAERQVVDAKRAARGQGIATYHEQPSGAVKVARTLVGMPDTLTRFAYEEQL
jgi:hypothetical protein